MLMPSASALLAQSYTLGNLFWLAIVFFILAIVAYVFGARGVAGMSEGIGRTLMFVFFILFIVFIIFGFVNRPV
jgi:uncharacterized membrane protein YtjA (UPF0391 family)